PLALPTWRVTRYRRRPTQRKDAFMLTARYLQLDVFTSRAGLGNPLGVVIGAQQWASRDMQNFARWTDLVETTFLLPAEHSQATYKLRIFTPQREIPFAGHPSVGSAHAALLAGV